MKRVNVVALVVMSAAIVSIGCGKKVPPAATAAPAPPVVEPAPPAPPRASASVPAPSSTALTEEELFARKSLAELNAERPLGDVRFELDDWTLGEDARVVLQKNADWLRRWASTRVTIEGHCDDRGTGEYNMALGERRAHAVKEYLGNLGVAPERIL